MDVFVVKARLEEFLMLLPNLFVIVVENLTVESGSNAVLNKQVHR